MTLTSLLGVVLVAAGSTTLSWHAVGGVLWVRERAVGVRRGAST